jgi:hypothetical protein
MDVFLETSFLTTMSLVDFEVRKLAVFAFWLCRCASNEKPSLNYS